MTENTETVDPLTEAAESLLYASPEEAAQKLRTAIHHEAARQNAHQGRQARINAELHRRHSYLKQFEFENPEMVNNLASKAAGEAFCYEELLHDLTRAGVLDLAKHREQFGHDPTFGEIANMHLQAAAHGVKGIRPVHEWFDRAMERTEEQVPAARRRIKDIDHSRKRAVQDRMNASAMARGLTPEEYAAQQLPSRMPNYSSYDGEPVTPQTMQRATLEAFGEGVTADQDAARIAKNKAAIAAMTNRTQGTDRRPGASVRFDRSADDRRFPDRRTSAA